MELLFLFYNSFCNEHKNSSMLIRIHNYVCARRVHVKDLSLLKLEIVSARVRNSMQFVDCKKVYSYIQILYAI